MITTYDLGTRTFQGTRAEIQAMLDKLRATRNDLAERELADRTLVETLTEQMQEGGAA